MLANLKPRFASGNFAEKLAASQPSVFFRELLAVFYSVEEQAFELFVASSTAQRLAYNLSCRSSSPSFSVYKFL